MGKIVSHNQMKKGFTIIEVILFVAISAALIVGLLLGVTSSVARQRYTDSVQDLADWLKTQYLAVSNPNIPEWSGGDLLDYINGNPLKKCNFTGNFITIEDESIPVQRGQSNCQMYGMLVVFGEPVGGEIDNNRVTIYPVLGMDDRRRPFNDYRVPTGPSNFNGNPLNDLRVSDIFVPTLNLTEDYSLQYSAQVQAVDGNALQASVLIVRPPRSGAVRTIIMNESIAVTDLWNGLQTSGDDPTGVFFPDDMLTNRFKISGDLNICVASDDVFAGGGIRRNIRIRAGGGNATAVELIAANEGICD